ncbi:MAG: indoleacetamide hydrolase [bacterium]
MRGEMSRRQFLQLLAAVGAAGNVIRLTEVALAGAAAPPPGLDELLQLTATEAVARMRSGDLGAETYATTLLARARSLRSLNALIAQDADQVLGAARAADKVRARGGRLGPLHGLPVLFKDNINTAALPTTGGSPALKDNRPRRNAGVVTALLRGGAVVLGKTNMHELAFGITSNNAAFGSVRNPYNPSLIPGGSSGGNAAAVAARMAPASIGTDTGGSTRIPAALCGIAGFRPTGGRYPGSGTRTGVTEIIPISRTRDTPGPMARSVADVALLDAVITAAEPVARLGELRGVRLGVDRRNFFQDLDPQVNSVVDGALRRFADRGVVLVPVEFPDLGPLNGAVGFPVAVFEAGVDLRVYLEANRTGLTLEKLAPALASPDVKFVISELVLKGAVREEVYRNAVGVARPALQAAYQRVFESSRIAALVFPTTPLPARPIGQDQTVELNGRQVPTFGTYIRHTDPAGNAGIPGLSLPVGLTADGLPVGLELDGPAGSDRGLLAIGLAIEAEFGFLPPPRPA